MLLQQKNESLKALGLEFNSATPFLQKSMDDVAFQDAGSRG